MKTLNYIIGIITIGTFASCEKEFFINENTTEPVAEIEEVTTPINYEDGIALTIDNHEYFKFDIPETIEKIIIEEGNGTIYIEEGRETEIAVPGYWVGGSGSNALEVSETTIRISNTFSQTYLTLQDLHEIEIVTGNSTVLMAKEFAKGKMRMDLGGNSTVTFKELEEEAEPILAEDFYVDLDMRNNGTFDSYGIIMNSLTAVVHENGTVRSHVKNELTVTISSNGTVYYKGAPTIESEIGLMGELVDEN